MCDVTPNQLKRKRTSSVDDDERTATSTCSSADQQLRRRVFELSLAKVRTAAPLTRSLRRRDPPLLRSVLILNTLRAVNASGIFVDVDPTLSTAAAAVVPPSTPRRSPSVLDELPGLLLVGDGRPLTASPLTEDLGSCSSPLTDGRPADDATSSSILDDLFGSSERTSSSSTTLVSSSPPVLTFSSLFDLDCASVWPTSSSSSMDVDLDLDVALFDFDLLQPLTVACAGGSRSSSSVQAAAGVLTTSTCTQRNQSFVDELEYISEILVGT